MLEILLLIYFCRYSNSLSFVFTVLDWFHHHVGRGADRKWSLDTINKDKPSPHLNHVRYTLLPSRPLSSLGRRHSRCHHCLLHLWRSEQAMRCLPNLLWWQTRQWVIEYRIRSRKFSMSYKDTGLLGQGYMVGDDKVLDPRKYFVVTFALFSNGEVRYDKTLNSKINIMTTNNSLLLHPTQ